MTEHTLRVLLVEDDTTSCMEINDYISRLDAEGARIADALHLII